MKNKLVLDKSMVEEYFRYSNKRINKNSDFKNYNMKNTYISFLSRVFIKNKLTVEKNGISYYYLNGEKQEICVHSNIGNENYEEMLEQLYHELFCKIERITRLLKSDDKDSIKYDIGLKDYKILLRK